MFSISKCSRSGSKKLGKSLPQEVTGTYLSYLDAPVKQQLRSDVVLVFMDVIQQAAVRHELRDQLDGWAQTHTQ